MHGADNFLDWLGRRIAGHITEPVSGYEPFTQSDPEVLRKVMRPGDVLLVEGNSRVSSAIKYLTNSTWSHAAIFVGKDALKPLGRHPEHELVEANLGEGVVTARLKKYRTFNTRICRPIGLTDADLERVIAFIIARIGTRYDLRNVIDLLRYLLPNPPVPMRFRRRMIALGSGDPTRAICSTLLAEAFHAVRYPILPLVRDADGQRLKYTSDWMAHELLHIRHHSLFAPRDFDTSPYFDVVKPTVELGFDYRTLRWAEAEQGQPAG
jgi:hypothetical protein